MTDQSGPDVWQDDPEPNAKGIRRVIVGLIAVQVAIAGALLVIDLGQSMPVRDFLTAPTPAGPSTRPYQPDRAPSTNPDGVPMSAPMSERLEFTGDGAEMTVRGQIAAGDGQRFTQELALRKQSGQPVQTVLLDSTGGSVSDALEIGAALRAAGIATRLEDAAVCLSACPYAFAGGETRAVAPTAKLGVHQHYFGESGILPAFMAVEDVQRGQAEVMAYLIRMGIDPRVMEHAMRTPPEQIYILSEEELVDYGFTEAPET